MRSLRYRLHAALHRLTAASHITLHHTWKMAIGATAIAIITAGVLLGVARLLSPMLGEFRGDIEAWATATTGQRVEIGALEADWSGWLPQIKLTDVRVYAAEDERVLLQFGSTLLRVDLLSYLRHRRIEPSYLALVGANLSLIRTPEGNIVLEGFEGSDMSEGLFVQWLLRQGRLDVRQSQVDWTDQEAGKARRRFDNVSFLLRTDGKRHQVTGELALPGVQPGHVALALDFGGDLAHPRSWDGKVHLRTQDVDLGQIQELLQWDRVAAQGVLDFSLWGEWSDTRLQQLEGEAAVRNVRFAVAGKPVLEMQRVSTQLQWRRESQGWSLAAERLVLERGNAVPAPVRLAVLASEAEDGAAVLDARVSAWRIEDAAALLLATGAGEAMLHAPLMQMQPHGQLRDVRLRFELPSSGADFKNFYLRARAENVRTRNFQSVPAFDNISGVLVCDEASGSFEIDTHQGHVVFRDLRKPLVVRRAAGTLGWERTEQGWRGGLKGVKLSNDDLSVHADGVIEWPHASKSPVIDLRTSFASVNIGRLPDYLPETMPEQVRAWFVRAFVAGRLHAGSAVVRGRLSDFPFDGSNGVAEARMTLREAVLDYESGWPWLGDIEGEVIVRGRSLEVNVASGKMLDSEVRQVSATIPDMTLEEPLLTVQGTAQGAATDVLRLLRESPLKQTMASYLTGVSASGTTTLDLDLLVPLSQRPNTIKGVLTFNEGALRYVDKPQERDIELTRINGRLNFTGDYHITGRDIDATLLGQKVKLALQTEASSATAGRTRTSLMVEARGRTDAAGIVRQLKKITPDMQARTLDWLSGETDWSGTLYLQAAADNASFESEWRLASSLRGMALKLPDPLGKPAAEETSFMVESAPASAAQYRRFNLHYGNRLQGAFEFAHATKTWNFARGELNFGSAPPKLPSQGLRINGEVERFVLADWLQLLTTGSSRTGGITGKLNAVDVQVGALEMYGQRINSIQIRAVQTPQAWEANVSSAELAGSLRWVREKEAMLVMELERLHLGKVTGTAAKGSDPRQWPALRVDVANFKYGDAVLGRLHLDAAKRSSGLRIDSITLAAPSFQINGQGDWVMEQERPASRFTAKASADDMGKMLTAFGYNAPVSEGKSQFDLTAAWAGSPADFTLEQLNGDLELRVTKGRLLEVDPGAGRVFGLLSLQALPRRLTLDFSDLFSKGFSFDRIEGNFVLENGNAYTNNLVMQGPAAKVSVAGRTGLAVKDYDQIVTVQPEISEGLSVGAGLAGGPVVGLSLFLANKLLPGLKDIAAYQYTIKGPWKEPIIAPYAADKASQKEPAG